MRWDSVTLNDGHIMPGIAFQVLLRSGPLGVKQIHRALDLGFSHLDILGGNSEAGKTLHSDGRSRSDFFVAVDWVRSNSGDARGSLQKILNDLGLNYVDLYLLNDPTITRGKIPSVWAQMEKLKEEGLTRSIGVMNFNSTRMLELVGTAKIQPAVNQLQFNPYATEEQIKLVKLCANRGIAVKAYNILAPASAPLSSGQLKNSIEEIATRVNTSLPRIILAWAKSKHVVPVLTRVETEQLEDNIETDEISLTSGDLNIIDGIAADREMRMAQTSAIIGVTANDANNLCGCIVV
ncbi:NADP-dependent oxidoreductase domain-containing protein [Mycena amicta]|nr:NADP-dependent oxidoreductase domain-containing protein [Mycena amicta]